MTEPYRIVGDFRGNAVPVDKEEFSSLALAAAVLLQVGPVDRLLEVWAAEDKAAVRRLIQEQERNP